MISLPNKLIDYFKEDRWTFDFKSVKLPKFNHPSLLVRWVVQESNWPYFPVDLPGADYLKMYEEALNVKDLFVEHREGETHRGWSSVCIHGEAFNRTRSWVDYEDNKGKNHDQIKYDWCKEVTDRCPVTYNFLKNLPFIDIQRIRFMMLEPGGFILPHNDRDLSMLNPLNIGLNQPAGCIFRMKDKGDVPFPEKGGACLVDISNDHSVWNNSNEVRIHIIVHGTPTEDFNSLVYQSITKVCNID
jgi:hypothetical protein